MDDVAEADVIAQELEQGPGKRRNVGYGPTTLREHVVRLDGSRERRRLDNALNIEPMCPTCGRYLASAPTVRALIEADADVGEVLAEARRIAKRPAR